MNTFKRASLISAVVAAFATFAATTTPVTAQTPGAAKPPAAAPAPQFDHHQNREPRAFSKPTERVEASLAYQRTALKITPQQQAQWDGYAAYARKQAKEMEQRFASMPPHGARPAAPANAIERLEREQAMLGQASTRLGERIAAQKPLYAVLSPEQQKVADQVLNPRHGGMMGGHGFMGGHGGGEHGGPHHDMMRG